MKFNASLLGFVSTALVLSLSFSSSATASSVVVRRSELSNRAVQPQNYVAPIVERATNSAEALQDYAEVALKSQPAPTKSELFSGLAKNLNKQTKKPLQSLYNHLDVAEPAVKDLKADVNDVYAIIKDLTAAFSSIAQDGSVTGQKIDDNDSAALKKSLEKISTHFNYIKTTPKLNQFEKAQIFAGNGDGFKNVLNTLKDQIQNLLSIVDTTVSGLVLDLLTPINALINLIVYFI